MPAGVVDQSADLAEDRLRSCRARILQRLAFVVDRNVETLAGAQLTQDLRQQRIADDGYAGTDLPRVGGGADDVDGAVDRLPLNEFTRPQVAGNRRADRYDICSLDEIRSCDCLYRFAEAHVVGEQRGLVFREPTSTDLLEGIA
jgi:hypothetical protein